MGIPGRPYIARSASRDASAEARWGSASRERPEEGSPIALSCDWGPRWAEFMEDLRAVDLERRRSENRWGIVLHSTSFRAMPATPAAPWPMSYHNYRGRVCRYLRAEEHVGQLFYEGRNLWAVESLGTESLATP